MLIKCLLSLSLIASIITFALLSDLPSHREEKKTEIPVIAQLPKAELETIAKAITVQVQVEEYRGLGILIARDNNTYTVITNAHVAERGDIYKIETSDGVTHTATTLLSKDGSKKGSDLAILQFNSSNKYQIAKVPELSPQLVAILPETSLAKTPHQQPDTSTQPRQYTGIVGKVDRIAQQITVRIDNLTNNGHGSGVIIARQRNSYYVATAKHVLCTNLDTSKCEANGQHQIVTPDGVTHKLDYQTVKESGKWLDVAVFRFESTNNYSVATLGKYDVGGRWVFVSGFLGVKSGSNTQPIRLLTGGTAREEEEKDFNRLVRKFVY